MPPNSSLTLIRLSNALPTFESCLCWFHCAPYWFCPPSNLALPSVPADPFFPAALTPPPRFKSHPLCIPNLSPLRVYRNPPRSTVYTPCRFEAPFSPASLPGYLFLPHRAPALQAWARTVTGFMSLALSPMASSMYLRSSSEMLGCRAGDS